jgi:hypothetical protein
MKHSPEYKIWQTLLTATENGAVPDGYYGPGTCRWATKGETQRFGLIDYPLVHLDKNGNIDCYFTETKAVVVNIS